MQSFSLDEILANCDDSHDPAQRRQNLVELLDLDEPIYAFVCPATKLLLATDKRLLSARLQREGFSRPRVTWITAAYNYEDISAIQYVEAMATRAAEHVVITYLGSDLVISDTPRLQAFSQTLNELMRQWKTRLKAARTHNADTLPALLRELHALYQSGILDADEYRAAKRKLIGA
jgi:hypothetical protein